VTLQPFSLEVPGDVPSALRLLEQHGDAASLYLGGTELLLILKLGLSSVDVLIDGKRLPELRGIVVEDGVLVLGAACTHREIESSEVVRRSLPALAELAARVANPRVRNVGTIGGNLCFAEPHSDPATLLSALDASVDLQSTAGVRRLPLTEFFEGPLQTALREAEIMTSVRVPLPDPGGARIAFERIAFHERPVANAAVRTGAGGTRIVVGAVGGRPQRMSAAEDLVRGGGDPSAIADAVMAAVEPLEDSHGSEDYKRHLAAVAVARCLRTALQAA
jgi:carbon-monoxide dehydrogenase medium subunit